MITVVFRERIGTVRSGDRFYRDIMGPMVLEKTLRAIALGGVFALPLIVFIVAESLFFPFITGKNFAFRIIVEVMTGAWLALVLVNPAYRPRRSWLLGAFALFVCIVALADVFGAYPFKSIWSNFERMDGFVTLVHLFFYFIVASSVLNTEKLWRAFWHYALAVSFLVGLHGLFQFLGIASLNPGFSSATRVDASFGNPIYLAVYMLFHAGLAALLWAQAWDARAPGRRFWISVLYGSTIAFTTLILLLTGTRGAMLGLGGGIVIGLILLAVSSRETWRWTMPLLLGLVLLASGFWLVRDAAWVNTIPGFNRLADISLEDNTTKARFMNWGMAWEGVKERPILGWGQENYAIVFDKYYNPQMYGQEQWFDRVHNVIFDWLVAAGFLGLFGYLAIFATAIHIVWKREVFNPYERSILIGILAAYFFQNLFVFDNIMSYLLFATVLAYVAWRGSQDAQAVPAPVASKRALPIVAVAALLLVWGVAWYVNARPLAANRALLSALQSHEEGLETNLEFFKQSISYGTTGTQEAREQLAQAAASIARNESVPVSVKQGFLNTAAEEMVAMNEESPLNARFPLFLGVLLNAYGNYEQGESALVRAHELSPGKQTILFELGANRFSQGKIDEALETFKQAFELAPEYVGARLYYAAVAIRAERDSLAEELLEPVVESGEAADQRVLAAYVSRGRYDKIIEIWGARTQARPSDVQAHLTLAAAYNEVGDTASAIATLQNLKEVAPTATEQADAFIEQIRGGTAEIQ